MLRRALLPGVAVFVACWILLGTFGGCVRRQPLFEPERDAPARIESVAPVVATESGGATVRLRATGVPFVAPVRVYFGESRGRIVRGTRVSATTREIVVVAPPHGAGVVSVRVVSGAGTPSERQAVLPDGFRYVSALRVDRIEPEIVSVEGEARVRISGRGFAAGVRVAIGDEPVPALERLSDESLVVTVPPRGAGKATLTVIAHAGQPHEQRVVLPDALTYATPSFGFVCLIATRLLDLSTSEALDARLVILNERVEGGSLPRDRLWEYVAGQVAGELPLHLLGSSGEGVGLVTLPDGGDDAVSRASSSLGSALGQTLRGRGVEVALGAGANGLTAAFPADEAPIGTLLTASEPPGNGVGKALIARIVALRESDAPTVADASAFDSLAAEYRRLESLAASLPESATAKTTMLVRLPDREGTATDAFNIGEDAVLAGARQRIAVIEKLAPVTTKPAWLAANLASPTDPLGYASWADFRKAHMGVESVFFYRPDATGLYARLVDAVTGRIVWSGRLLTAEDVFSDGFASSVHDRIRDLADRSDWVGRASKAALVWVAPAGDDTDPEPWEGVASSLAGAAIGVCEPMATVYKRRELAGGRVAFAEDADASDVWFDAVRNGASHFVEYALNRSNPDLWTMTFRLLDAKSRTVVDSWRVSEGDSWGDADANP